MIMVHNVLFRLYDRFGYAYPHDNIVKTLQEK